MNAFGIVLMIAVALGIMLIMAIACLVVLYRQAKKLEKRYNELHSYMMKRGTNYDE